jgi:hypothetical protein
MNATLHIGRRVAGTVMRNEENGPEVVWGTVVEFVQPAEYLRQRHGVDADEYLAALPRCGFDPQSRWPVIDFDEYLDGVSAMMNPALLFDIPTE